MSVQEETQARWALRYMQLVVSHTSPLVAAFPYFHPCGRFRSSPLTRHGQLQLKIFGRRVQAPDLVPEPRKGPGASEGNMEGWFMRRSVFRMFFRRDVHSIAGDGSGGEECEGSESQKAKSLST